MKQHNLAPLGHHGIEIQILLHAFPKLERMAVKFGIAGHHIVGAHNRRIAPDIAPAKVAFFQHRNILQTVIFGKVIGRGKPMPAPANDDDVIGAFGLWPAPMGAPTRIARQTLL